MAKSYFEQRMDMLNYNYNTYFNQTLRTLQREYKQAFEDIELEILRWYKQMEEIKASTPTFQFSELKQLEELQKQIKLILDELSNMEADKLGANLNQLYVSDYMGLAKLNEKYGTIANIPLPQFNQLQSTRVLESYLSMPQAQGDIANIAKQLDLSWWYSPIQGKWFNTRIQERAEKLGYSIEQILRQAIIRGDGYNKIAGQVMRDLDISFRSAKTLVATELRQAEITSTIHNSMKNGFTHLRRETMNDSHVCKICREMDGKIYPIEEVNAGDFMLHPNDRCVLVPVLVDENGNRVKSQFEDEAKAWIENRSKENAERTRKIREQHKLAKE